MNTANHGEVIEEEASGNVAEAECMKSEAAEVDVDTSSATCTSTAKSSSAVSQNEEKDTGIGSIEKDDYISLMAVSVAVKRSMEDEHIAPDVVAPGAVRVPPLEDKSLLKDDLTSEMAVSVAIEESLSTGTNTPGAVSAQHSQDETDQIVMVSEDHQSLDTSAREGVPGANVIDNSVQTHCSPTPTRTCDYNGESWNTGSCPEENVLSDAVRAYKVSDEVVHATPAPLEVEESPNEEEGSTPANRNSDLTMAIYIATGAVVLLVVIILVLVFSTKEDNSGGERQQHSPGDNEPIVNGPSSAGPPENCPDPAQDIFLVGLEEKVIENIGKPCSPQAFANAWMLDDPFKWDYTGARLFQRFILVSAFYALGVPNIDPPASERWLSYNVSECLWGYPMGDENICSQNNVMNVLNLTKTGLYGTIPDEFLIHQKAKIVDVSANNLYGGFPAIGDGVYGLEEVNLSNNQLTGWFQFETDPSNPFARLSRPMALRKLELQNNPIKVSFADLLPGALPNLTYFDISNNQIYGRIPKGIFQYIGKLEIAKMANNNLEGLMDPSLATLSNLRHLDLSGNTNLFGTIPGPFASLEYLDLRDTRVDGPVPQDLCDRASEGEVTLLLDNCGPDGWSDCCTGTRNLLRVEA